MVKDRNNNGGSARDDIRQLNGDVERGLEDLGAAENIEVVVAIPFFDEDETLPGVVQTARRGLEQLGLAGRSLVLCVGPKENAHLLKAALELCRPDHGVPVHHFAHGQGLEGHGWSVRVIMEIASRLGTSLLILPPNLVSQANEADEHAGGFSPRWIATLLDPVRNEEQELALAKVSCHHFAHLVESFLVYPVITEVFGFRLRQPTPAIMALSPRLVRSCLSAEESWPGECGGYGFDPWLVTHALVEGFSICEVPIGLASFRYSVGRLKLVFRQVAHTLLKQVVDHSDWWLNQPEPINAPATVAEPHFQVKPPAYDLDRDALYQRFKQEFDHFDETLLRAILPDDFRTRMERLADEGPDGVVLSSSEWVDVVNRFLLAYKFETEFYADDIVDGLFPFFLARVTTYMENVKSLEARVTEVGIVEAEWIPTLVGREAGLGVERQTDLFASMRRTFRESWRERASKTTPYLPRLGAWEFVPNVGVMVPQELEKPDGGFVWASPVYQDLIDRYRTEFMAFLANYLDLDHVADSGTVLTRMHDFVMRIDRALNERLFPGDPTSLDGVRAMTEKMVEIFSKGPCFQLTPDAAHKILSHAPPGQLIMRLRTKGVAALVERYGPADALAMAAWTERRFFLEQVLDLIEENGDPSWFYDAPLDSVIVNVDYLSDPTELRGVTPLARLAGRVLRGNLQKGWGGEYPTLWYFLKLLQSIVGVEAHSALWRQFAQHRSDFSKRLVDSIRGHWGRHVLSAHNLFENRQQRIVAERLREFSRELSSQGGKHDDLARLIDAMASVYHLSITLPDATFVPLSAWTWTSYSYRGGLGAPTPLSSLVERDWATMDFITEYLSRAGLGDEKSVNRTIDEMIGEGRESDDVSYELFGITKKEKAVVIPQTPSAPARPAGKLVRPVNGPILEPIADHWWESQYVLNAAAVRLDGAVYILYRAFGTDKKSRIGLAWTKDGVNIDGRLDPPIFGPAGETEKAGVEDPRVTVIGDRMYMLYTAWDEKVAQISMASIGVEEFLAHRFDKWERHGPGFPQLANKDAALYPEKFDGHYVLYHRIDPNMWISYLEDLTCPFPRTGQKIVVGPRPGMMWDGIKIGAGAQPIKTTHGWLNIYHGVDYERSYRLGVLFMDLEDPSRVIYQSPNPILEPELDFEIGNVEGRDYWVPHVVFTCGAVPAQDKEIMELDDEVLVYYGAADTAIGVAKGKLRDLVPVLRDNTPDKTPVG